ncbi:MAG: anti-sigma factor domain-containing protein [Gemmatimonadales bacterium]
MSQPEQESVRDLAAAYALGALGTDDLREFERLLAGSADLQRDVAEYREVAALLGLGESGTGPPADLRVRVLATAKAPGAGVTALPRRKRSPVAWAALAAGIAAIALGAAVLSLRGDLRERDMALAQRDSTVAVQQQQVAERQALLETVLDPEVRLYQLTASGDPNPGIQLFWNQRRNQALVNAYRLKPIPAGRAYQLWFIRDGKPVPSVTFSPKNGAATVSGIKVPSGGKISAAAITVEPSSGSAQPTSPIILSGPI